MSISWLEQFLRVLFTTSFSTGVPTIWQRVQILQSRSWAILGGGWSAGSSTGWLAKGSAIEWKNVFSEYRIAFAVFLQVIFRVIFCHSADYFLEKNNYPSGVRKQSENWNNTINVIIWTPVIYSMEMVGNEFHNLVCEKYLLHSPLSLSFSVVV